MRKCREQFFFLFFTSLAEAEGATEALAGLDDGLVQAGELLVDEPTTVPESANGAKEGEEDEEEEQGLRLIDGDARLQVQLGKDAFPGDASPSSDACHACSRLVLINPRFN